MTDPSRRPAWRLADVLDQVPCAVIVHDLATEQIQYWNQPAEALFGWSAAEALGQRASVLLTLGLSVSRAGALAQVTAQGRWEGTATAVTRGGRQCDLEIAWALLTDAAGKPVAVSESIRERVLSREHQDERIFFASVLNAIDVGVVACDNSGALAFINRQASIWYPRMTGSVSIASWMHAEKLLKADHSPWPVAQLPLYRALAGETVRDVEFVSMVAGGGETTRIVHGQPVFDADGVQLGAVIVVHEATAFRQTTAQLEKREWQVAVTEQMGEWGLWEYEVAADVAVWSPAVYAIMGRDPSLGAMTLADLISAVHPEDRERVGRTIQAASDVVAEVVGAGGLDYRIVRPSGEVRYLTTSAMATRSAEGRTERLMGVIKDITSLREAERLKDEFLSAVSHELRTPLTAVRAAISLIASGVAADAELSGDQTPLSLAERGITRLETLVTEIVDVERLRSGSLKFEIARHDAASQLVQAVTGVQSLIRQAGLRLTVHSPHAALAVCADARRLQQALTHLLDNAIAFSPPGATLTVGLTGEGNEIHFYVSDQGPGIARHLHEAIFERFRQVDGTDTRVKQGPGLGLAFARSVVEAQGGRLWVTSEPGCGATFYLALPAADRPG